MSENCKTGSRSWGLLWPLIVWNWIDILLAHVELPLLNGCCHIFHFSRLIKSTVKTTRPFHDRDSSKLSGTARWAPATLVESQGEKRFCWTQPKHPKMCICINCKLASEPAWNAGLQKVSSLMSWGSYLRSKWWSKRSPWFYSWAYLCSSNKSVPSHKLNVNRSAFRSLYLTVAY